MPEPVERTQIGYYCARCNRFAEVKSVFTADLPDGFFIWVKRIQTSQHRRNPIRTQKVTPQQVYLCDKECLLQWVQFRMNSEIVEWRPIGEPS